MPDEKKIPIGHYVEAIKEPPPTRKKVKKKSFAELEVEQKKKRKNKKKKRYTPDPMINTSVGRKMEKGGKIRNMFTQQYD